MHENTSLCALNTYIQGKKEKKIHKKSYKPLKFCKLHMYKIDEIFFISNVNMRKRHGQLQI